MMLLALALMTSAAMVACGSDKNSSSGSGAASASGSGSAPAKEETTHASFKEGDANTVIKVNAIEYAFQLSQASAAGPKVFFEVTNSGTITHEFEIVGPDGKAVDEISSFPPKETKTLPVELKPGSYTLQCLLITDGKIHANLGMKATLTVT